MERHSQNKSIVVGPARRTAIFEIVAHRNHHHLPSTGKWRLAIKPTPATFHDVEPMTAVHDALEHLGLQLYTNGKTRGGQQTLEVHGNGTSYRYTTCHGSAQDEMRALATMWYVRGSRWGMKGVSAVTSVDRGWVRALRMFPDSAVDCLQGDSFTRMHNYIGYEIYRVWRSLHDGRQSSPRHEALMGTFDSLGYSLRLGDEDEHLIDVVFAEALGSVPIRKGAATGIRWKRAVGHFALMVEPLKEWFRIGLLEARARFGHLEDSRKCMDRTFAKIEEDIRRAMSHCRCEHWLDPTYKGPRRAGYKIEAGDLLIVAFDETRAKGTLPTSVCIRPA